MESQQESSAAWDALWEPRKYVPGLKQCTKLYFMANVV